MGEQDIEDIRIKNIVDMAVTFTAMMRVFRQGSKSTISKKIAEVFSSLDNVTEETQYRQIHDSFCIWFTKEIFTAEKTFKNGRGPKMSRNASYGQAAKIFDIAAKVYVYYCKLPSPHAAERLLPMLYGAVDTPIMKNLKSKFRDVPIAATTIEEIDKPIYETLQRLIMRDIETGGNRIYPVQYDDIEWHKLNRTQQ